MTKCGVHFLWLTVRLQMTIENMVCAMAHGKWRGLMSIFQF